jgi:DNA polymerase-4
MNAFFASVEQQEHIELRDKPVAVAPFLTPSCTIVAASYEARAYGIGVGTKISQATELCPQLNIVGDSPSDYRRYHDRIMAILRDTYCQVGVRSIDEAYLIVPSYARTRDDIMALIEVITSRFRIELGEYLKCSIGVGPNIWCAKMAAGSNKPNGRTFLPADSLVGFYRGLPLVRCTGIGRRMARQLYALGVSDTADLAVRSLGFLRSHLGVVGEKWYLRLRGYEVDLDPRIRRRQSMSHQVTVIGERNLSNQQSKDYIRALALRLATRMRSYGLYAGGVGVFVSFMDRSGQHAYTKTSRLSGDGELVGAALTLFGKLKLNHHTRHGIRLFSLYIDGLSLVQQPSLPFADAQTAARDHALSYVIDELNRRYGSKAVVRASGLAQELSPDRIGFGHL